jgi:uncharacterized protein (TIGR04255 family)
VPIEEPLIAGFASRVMFHLSDAPLSAAVVTALEPSLDGKFSTVVLDIDVFQESDLGCSTEEITPVFQSLRALKDELFFSYIGPRAKEMFA